MKIRHSIECFFLNQSNKDATDIVAVDHGNTYSTVQYSKKGFRTFLHFLQCQNPTSHSKCFLLLTLEARNFALSLTDKVLEREHLFTADKIELFLKSSLLGILIV